MKNNLSLCLLTLVMLCFACQSSKGQAEEKTEPIVEPAPIIQDMARPRVQQLIVITTGGWNEVQGTLHRFEGSPNEWNEVGAPIPIVVGKKGMAWGKGTQEFQQKTGSSKKEGDLRSPAGWFNLGSAFGSASESQMTDLLFPYLHVNAQTMCIEDDQSRFYNQIVEEGEFKPDWTSTDHMLRKDDLYEWGIFVEHNFPQPVEAGGSCIFLHVWRNEKSGTAGCTAMQKIKMQELIAWLDESKLPQMVQMPLPVYRELNEMYDLPYIK